MLTRTAEIGQKITHLFSGEPGWAMMGNLSPGARRIEKLSVDKLPILRGLACSGLPLFPDWASSEVVPAADAAVHVEPDSADEPGAGSDLKEKIYRRALSGEMLDHEVQTERNPET